MNSFTLNVAYLLSRPTDPKHMHLYDVEIFYKPIVNHVQQIKARPIVFEFIEFPILHHHCEMALTNHLKQAV